MLPAAALTARVGASGAAKSARVQAPKAMACTKVYATLQSVLGSRFPPLVGSTLRCGCQLTHKLMLPPPPFTSSYTALAH